MAILVLCIATGFIRYSKHRCIETYMTHAHDCISQVLFTFYSVHFRLLFKLIYLHSTYMSAIIISKCVLLILLYYFNTNIYYKQKKLRTYKIGYFVVD